MKAELLREQIKRERGRNRRESGDVVEREVVEAMLATLGQKLDLLLLLKLEVELARIFHNKGNIRDKYILNI